ncbi:DUF3905 domain-containing protein [Ferviditalea candida]|uniref:DUF3905 domain-containing protein n=1 Tax=Ferviditalea candida TaxID=3108399 RepID=A0ABU5ZIG8_9BACL|nr:DUF3905 domain-containing protein [Paenibacillaceae bacterium T2]
MDNLGGTADAFAGRDLDPFEIEFLPEFQRGRGPREAFVNEHGVVIGDHQYESPNSPLNQWSKDTDPAVMAGDEWVHPYKDIGFQSAENRDYFEKGIVPQSGIFEHADKDAAYPAFEAGTGAGRDSDVVDRAAADPASQTGFNKEAGKNG